MNLTSQTKKLIQQAGKVYAENFPKTCYFERAIFLSWYCSLGDCTFCYMSTQKDKIKDPKKARRRLSSVLAEVLLSKKLNWKIEFLSVGYGAYTFPELLEIVKKCSMLAKEKLWLNIGYLNQKEIKLLLPYIKGVSASIETVNWKLRKKICPSKPLPPLLETLKLAEQYKLKKSITIIIGLGEKITDIPELFNFIQKYKLDRVTFYSLNPHPGTPFQTSPKSDYYLQWIAQTRIKFPKLEIIAGSWTDRLEEFPLLLKAGTNSFTKLPATRFIGTKKARKLEEDLLATGRTLQSTLSTLPKITEQKISGLSPELSAETLAKLKIYLKKMENNIKAANN